MDRPFSGINVATRKLPDTIGILSSGLCLVHCLGAPLLTAIGMELFTEEWLKYPFLVLSLVAVYYAGKCCTHGLATVLWCSFVVLFFASLFMEEYPWLHFIAYAASASVIICHTINLVKHRSNPKHD